MCYATRKSRWNLFATTILALGCLLLEACSSAPVSAATQLVLNAKLADVLVQEGAPQNTVLTAPLTETEALQVVHAVDTYQLIRNKWQGVVEDPTALATNLILLSTDYATLYGEYRTVFDIVQHHWDEYSPQQQAMLTRYHNQALAIHDDVRQLLVHQKQAEAAANLLSLGVLVAKAVVL